MPKAKPKYEEGDRVAVDGVPEPCGTVRGVLEDHMYLISWDNHMVGRRPENELMPCPESHTDQPPAG
jgi:hypothetical protein